MTNCPVRNIECSGMQTYDYIRDTQGEEVIDLAKVAKLCGNGMNLYMLQDLEKPNVEVPRPDCALTHFVLNEVLVGERDNA